MKKIQLSSMCRQTLIIFARCPCRKTRISTCPNMQDQEYRAWRHFDPIPDHRGCKSLETFEDFSEGCCEMAPGGTCPYNGRRTFDTPQVPQVGEEKLGIFPGENYARGWKSRAKKEVEVQNNLWRTVSEPRKVHRQPFGKLGGHIRSASLSSSGEKDSSSVHPAGPSFLRQAKTSISTLQKNCNPLHDLPLRNSLKTGLESLHKIHNPLDVCRPLGSNEDIEPCE
jgi:hypothetical protein